MNIHGKSPYLIRFNITCLVYDSVCTLAKLVHPLISEIALIRDPTIILALLITLLVTALLTIAPRGQLIS